jgi:hypothetical protein
MIGLFTFGAASLRRFGEGLAQLPILRYLIKMTEEVSKLDRLGRVCSRLISEGCPSCDICNSFTTSNYDFLMTCMSCGVQVHTECWPHGNMHKFECPKCQFCRELERPLESVQCMICPVMSGFMTYSTRAGHWVHMSCLKTLDNKSEGVCMYCGDDYGSTMRCQVKHCSYHFHVKCMEVRGYTEISVKNRELYACRHHAQAHTLKLNGLFRSGSKSKEPTQKVSTDITAEELSQERIKALKRAKLKQLSSFKKVSQSSSQMRKHCKVNKIDKILAKISSPDPQPGSRRFRVEMLSRGRPSNTERLSRKREVISAMLQNKQEKLPSNIVEILRGLLERDDIMPMMCAEFRKLKHLLKDSKLTPKTRLILPERNNVESWRLGSKDSPATSHKTFVFMLMNKRVFTIQVPVVISEDTISKEKQIKTTHKPAASIKKPLSSFPEKVLRRFGYLRMFC